MTGKRWRAVLLITAGLLVGYVIGPPIVHAATSLVTIQGAGSTNKAKVTKQGRLFVDTEAGTFGDYLKTFASTYPDGGTLIARGTSVADLEENHDGIVTGVLLDVPPNGVGTGAVMLQMVRKSDGAVIYQGTVPGTGGHLSDQVNGGFFIPDRSPSLEIIVTNTGTSAFQFVVYGDGFGAPFDATHVQGRR
jgi:hypothetical protein